MLGRNGSLIFPLLNFKIISNFILGKCGTWDVSATNNQPSGSHCNCITKNINSWKVFKVSLTFKGAGDPGKVKIKFYVVSDRRKCQLTNSFYQIRKYCS